MARIAIVDSAAMAVGRGLTPAIQDAIDAVQSDIDTTTTDLQDLTDNLQSRVAASGATVHPDGVNTDCNTLSHGNHIIFSDGSNATSPAPAGLYLVEQRFLALETGTEAVSQLAWRYSTGLLYTRIKRLDAWTGWNKVG